MNITASNARPAPTLASMVLKRVGLLMAQLDCLPYAVGGMVRDRMLGRISGDMDIAVAGDVCSIAQTLARELHCAWFMLDDERGMARLVPEGPLPEWQIDLGHYDGTIEDDLGRRDFTVNAMAAPLAGFSEGALAGLVDPYGGSVDLAQGKLRMVSSGAFESDPLRLLRFARFSASLNLTPDQTVVSAARASARLIAGIPGERIHEELARILSLRPAGPALRLLESVGLMDIIFPSLRETRRIEASGDHQWDVFEHSLRTLEAFEFLGGESDWTSCPVSLEKFPAWLSPLFISLETPVGASNTRRSMAKLGALLHDIGKPATLSREASGRLRFIGHALTGAELAREELSRLRYGKQEIEYVNLLVRLHLRPFQLSNEGLPTGRAVYRFCRDAGQAWREVIMIALADHLATSGPRLDAHEWNERVRLASFIVDERGRQLELLVRPGRLVDGHDLKTAFPSASGPAIGHLLETLEEATSVGSIRTRGEALKLASETILRDNSTNPISRGVTN